MPVATKKQEPEGNMGTQSFPSLPLPIHFDLLPTIAPGKTLCPVFYVLIDGIPIYLTLGPSNAPHLSLLPIFLTLHPISPLSILSTLHLKPNKDYSLTVKGTAPHVDIWVPITAARIICDSLGIRDLFWDKKDPTRGLLSTLMSEAQSWDDGPAIGHNWIPPPSQLPKTDYSLSTLLTTPFTGIDIIQDHRYITTILDVDAKHTLIRDAKNGNPSRIREGNWAEAWEGVIVLSDLAWKDFLQYPSTPKIPDLPSHVSLANPRESKIVHAILPLLPSLICSESSLPTYPFTLSDLQMLYDAKPIVPNPQISLTSILSSFIVSPESRARKMELREKQFKARLGICLCESLGGILVSSFQAQLLINENYHKRGRKGQRGAHRNDEKGVYIFVENPDHPDFHRHSSRSKRREDDNHNTSRNGKKDQISSNADVSMEDLEKKRGASPDPDKPHKTQSSHHKSSRATSQSAKKTSSPPSSAHTRSSSTPSTFETQSSDSVNVQHTHTHKQKHKHRSEETNDIPPLSPSLSSSSSSSASSSEDSDGELTTTPPTIHSRSTSTTSTNNQREIDIQHPEKPPHFGIIESIDQFPLGDWNWNKNTKKLSHSELMKRDKKEKIMLSENGDGWQPYRALLVAILLGWFLGYCQVF